MIDPKNNYTKGKVSTGIIAIFLAGFTASMSITVGYHFGITISNFILG